MVERKKTRIARKRRMQERKITITKIDPDVMYTNPELAAILRTTPGTVSVGRSTGRLDIPCVKRCGLRFKGSDILEWLARNTVRAGRGVAA